MGLDMLEEAVDECIDSTLARSIFTDNSTMSTEVENILTSEFATQIGVHSYDKSLDDHSLGAYAKRQDDCRDFIKKL